ncbi:MAG: carotenoid 1,2-hydratase [Thermoanaerobaculia bacterium]|nr:carotenoid 1,2-hydratase [Thermoanaerobaculia bacterium]
MTQKPWETSALPAPGRRRPGRLEERARCLSFVSLLLLTAITSVSEAASRFRPLDPKEPIRFPKDHGAHDDARIEWWYVTGHLSSPSGDQFGYQLTFFRAGLLDEPAGSRSSRWAARDLHLAHFARTDLAKKEFRYAERSQRSGPEAAFARGETLDVANGAWRLLELGGRFVLLARDGADELSLLLEPEKPPVLHGEKGLSRKGPEPDAVSKYVSFTRMRTTGWLRTARGVFAVTGSSWMDHEWGSGSIGRESAGWDWFSIQLDDGREAMLYQIRGKEGAPTRFTSGTLVEKDGRTRLLLADDFTVTVLDRWKSEKSGAIYPSKWRVEVPGAGLEMVVTPVLPDQELITNRSTFVTYWEGACEVKSSGQRAVVLGKAYVEMTGYAGKGALGILSGAGGEKK